MHTHTHEKNTYTHSPSLTLPPPWCTHGTFLAMWSEAALAPASNRPFLRKALAAVSPLPLPLTLSLSHTLRDAYTNIHQGKHAHSQPITSSVCVRQRLSHSSINSAIQLHPNMRVTSVASCYSPNILTEQKVKEFMAVLISVKIFLTKSSLQLNYFRTAPLLCTCHVG